MLTYHLPLRVLLLPEGGECWILLTFQTASLIFIYSPSQQIDCKNHFAFCSFTP